MVFELEEGSQASDSEGSRPVLPLIEPAPSRSNNRHRTARQANLRLGGLPEAFAGLRPASLPAPSSVRPPLRSYHQGVDSSLSQAAMHSPPPRVNRMHADDKVDDIPVIPEEDEEDEDDYVEDSGMNGRSSTSSFIFIANPSLPIFL